MSESQLKETVRKQSSQLKDQQIQLNGVHSENENLKVKRNEDNQKNQEKLVQARHEMEKELVRLKDLLQQKRLDFL